MQPAVVHLCATEIAENRSPIYLEKYYQFYSAIVQAVLSRLSNLGSEGFSRQVSTNEDLPAYGLGYSPATWARQNIGAGLTPQPVMNVLIEHSCYVFVLLVCFLTRVSTELPMICCRVSFIFCQIIIIIIEALSYLFLFNFVSLNILLNSN